MSFLTPPRKRVEGPHDLYAIVAEWADQGPILMETEGPYTSREAAQERADYIRGNRTFLRYAIVRLVYEGGNALVLHDMRRMQGEVSE